MAHEFPNIPHAGELLKSMRSHTTFQNGEPSADASAFLSRIQNADPNSPEISEDDTNQCWGHYQFSGAGMTCTSVLTSWASVGNTGIARQLIAAAIKTCRVARHLCFQRAIESTSFLSDAYLENIIDILWTLWIDAGGVCVFFYSKMSNLQKIHSLFRKTSGKLPPPLQPLTRLQPKLLPPHPRNPPWHLPQLKLASVESRKKKLRHECA